MIKIPQMMPWFGIEEKAAVCDYMENCGFITEYKLTQEFEAEIAKFTKSKHAIVVNNGTVSLTLAGLALGVGPGDEVIVPNYTMIATPNSMALLGAIPVFVDVCQSTLCIDVNKIENAITKKTKAIIAVSANGRYSEDYVKLKNISNAYRIPVIEDAAQALGSYYPSGEHVGTYFNVGSFSFSAPKIISTGQGGALVTNDDELAWRIRNLKDFGRSQGGTDIHDVIGYNFKFTELQAAVGLAQIKKLNERISRKKQLYSLYKSEIGNLCGFDLFHANLKFNTPWFYDAITQNREELIGFLESKGIGTRKMYPPINKQKAYMLKGDYSISDMVGMQGLWLPSYTQITDEDIKYVSECIKEFYS
jgi:perosamine synthetase